jgi:MFS family permease
LRKEITDVVGQLGVSAAMVVPPAIGILGAAYETPSKRKNLAFSAFSAGNPLGFVFGSIISGLATMVLNWRASFVLIAILWVLFTVLAYFTVPSVEAFPANQPFRERAAKFVKTFDFLGTVLTILGTGLLTAAITLVLPSFFSSSSCSIFLCSFPLLIYPFSKPRSGANP